MVLMCSSPQSQSGNRTYTTLTPRPRRPLAQRDAQAVTTPVAVASGNDTPPVVSLPSSRKRGRTRPPRAARAARPLPLWPGDRRYPRGGACRGALQADRVQAAAALLLLDAEPWAAPGHERQ